MIELIFMILVVGNCAAQCPENRGNACCVDYEWDEVLGQCKIEKRREKNPGAIWFPKRG